MINMSTNGGSSASTGGSSIRNSMLRHWRNSSIVTLGRSGSKKGGDRSEEKAAKRLSIPVVSSSGTSTPKPPEAPPPAAADQQLPPPEQTDAETPNDVAAPPSQKGISLHVTVHIAPQNAERFLAAFKAIFDVVAAEPECTFFEVYRSPEEPGKFSWVENWSKDRQWFIENQITKPYYKEYFEITEPMFLKPREATMLELVGPEFSVIKGNAS
ncbi:hypothetical protein GGR53DRAFT_131736 [Hypoxylon sp. FL1150]|nr:hypothetical protein GGR53DRAFT_131736 [Hypoxylon sp. FL1150]